MALAALLGLPTQASAAITLTSGGSTVNIDENSQSGAFNWVVNGTDHLFQQWFWYRLGDSGPELSLETLDATPTVTPIGTNGALVLYDSANLDVSITYILTGTVGFADLVENISVINTSGQSLHFFQYSDFDLNNTAGDDRAAFLSNQTVRQVDPTLGGSLSETVVSPSPSHRELAFFDVIRDKLTDGDADNLADTPVGAILGPGDITWAFQWDAGASLTIAKDKRLDFVNPPNIPDVPEPTALAIWGLGLGLLTGVRSFRRRCG
jgi:hypothetical protein